MGEPAALLYLTISACGAAVLDVVFACGALLWMLSACGATFQEVVFACGAA